MVLRREWGLIGCACMLAVCISVSAPIHGGPETSSGPTFPPKTAPDRTRASVSDELSSQFRPPRPDVVYCYAPGTPEEVIKKHAYPAPLSNDPSLLFNALSRWSGSMGTPR